MHESDDFRRAVDETRQTLEALADELKSEPKIGLSDQHRKTLTQEIQKTHPPQVHGGVVVPDSTARKIPIGRFAAIGAVAASLMVACGLTALWYLKRTSDMETAFFVAASGDRADSASPEDVTLSEFELDTIQTVSERPTPEPLAPELTVNLDSSMANDMSAAEISMQSAAPAPRQPEEPTKTRLYEDFSVHPPVPPAVSGLPTQLASAGSAPSPNDTRNVKDWLPSAGERPAEAADFGVDRGEGPGRGGDKYSLIVENPFKEVKNEPLSTFSIDVDTASYAKVRMYLMQNRVMPRPDAVRIEELVNYFTYSYQPPTDDVPFAAAVEVAECPWRSEHRLVRVGIKGEEIDNEQRPASNLVFLLDVSGSMNRPNKLPLLKRGMKMLVDQLGENDRVAIAVYANAAGLVLDSTTGDQKQVIIDALDRLHAGGSTNGGEGVHLAYQTALDNFIKGGVNRVILCTDGDFNVGVTGTDELARLAEKNGKTGVFLSVLGFGMGNHNDDMLEQISNKGNGNYAFIDTDTEARKVLVEQMSGTLVTIAKDVKIQIEFNPVEVAAYRLIGYENRILAAQDFNDDKKDAGEIGAGHTVTALYEVVPVGVQSDVTPPPVDDSRYQKRPKPTKEARSGEMLTLKIRYKEPDGDTSTKLTFLIKDEGKRFGQATQDFRFAASVASFGMLLRDSQHKGNATYAGVLEIATEAATGCTSGYRQEFLAMVTRAKGLSGQ